MESQKWHPSNPAVRQQSCLHYSWPCPCSLTELQCLLDMSRLNTGIPIAGCLQESASNLGRVWHSVGSSAIEVEEKCLSVQGIRYLHEAIRSALGSFADEARALRANGAIEPQALSALVERQRFLRSVCHFHMSSEEDLILPVARYTALELLIGRVINVVEKYDQGFAVFKARFVNAPVYVCCPPALHLRSHISLSPPLQRDVSLGMHALLLSYDVGNTSWLST